MFSTVTSAFFSISLTIATPRGDLRLIASDRLLALNMWKYHGSSSGFPGRSRRPRSPVFGFSILTTSAPSQASASVQEVPASNWVKSTTRMPARQSRSWLFSFMADPPARAWLPGSLAERHGTHQQGAEGARWPRAGYCDSLTRVDPGYMAGVGTSRASWEPSGPRGAHAATERRQPLASSPSHFAFSRRSSYGADHG